MSGIFMTNIFVLIVFFISPFAFGKSKNCEMVPSFPVQYHEGVNPYHEATTNLGTVKVGGLREKIPENTDRLAIQRALLNCTRGILKCFNKKQGPLGVVMVSFELSPSGEEVVASGWSFSSNGKVPAQFTGCLSQVLAEAKFGLILTKSIQVTTSLQVKE